MQESILFFLSRFVSFVEISMIQAYRYEKPSHTHYKSHSSESQVIEKLVTH